MIEKIKIVLSAAINVSMYIGCFGFLIAFIFSASKSNVIETIFNGVMLIILTVMSSTDKIIDEIKKKTNITINLNKEALDNYTVNLKDKEK